MKTWVWVLSVALLAGCVNSNKDEQISLKLIYKAGEVQKIETEATTDGGKMKIRNITQLEFKVDNESGGKYAFEAKILRITSDSDMFGKKETYDSAADYNTMTDSEKELHSEMAQSLQSTFLFTLDQKGKIITPFHTKDGGAEKDPIDIATVIIPLPDKPVKIGDEWNAVKHNPLLDIDTKTTYRLQSFDEDEIVIGVTSEIGAVKGLLAENKAEGAYTLDRKTCQLIKGVFSMKMQGGTGNIVYRVTTKK